MNVTDIVLRAISPNNDRVPLFRTQIDYQGGTKVIYLAFAPRGTADSDKKWVIGKLTYDVNDNVTNIDWAPESSAYSDRAILTYA